MISVLRGGKCCINDLPEDIQTPAFLLELCSRSPDALLKFHIKKWTTFLVEASIKNVIGTRTYDAITFRARKANIPFCSALLVKI